MDDLTTARPSAASATALLERTSFGNAELWRDRPPTGALPGAASDGVQTVLQKGVHMHAQLIDSLRGLIHEEDDCVEEWTELFSCIRRLLDEMNKTLSFFPDRSNFEREFREFRRESTTSPTSTTTTTTTGEEAGPTRTLNTSSSGVLLQHVIGNYPVDLYRLYFEVLARGGYIRVNEEGTWYQVWEHIGDRGREPIVPLSYEDEHALRATYVDTLYPFECLSRQRYDGQ